MGQGKVYAIIYLCNYSCTISFLVKILLVNLKNIYIHYAWVSIIKKKILPKKCEVWKNGGICQNLRPLPLQVQFWSLFQLSSRTVKGFETEI